jgi:hypothetical protein
VLVGTLQRLITASCNQSITYSTPA